MYTFIRTAENCGFWDKVLVTTFSDFGRRLEENSRKGTDHGWGSYNFVFAVRRVESALESPSIFGMIWLRGFS